MEKKKFIIWDFDGPIVNSRELALELSQVNFHDVDEHVHRRLFMGNVLAELTKLTPRGISVEESEHFLLNSYWPRVMNIEPIDGISDQIISLSDNFDMVINSSGESVGISEYLEKNNLKKYFKNIYGKEIKSKSEKFKIIFDTYNVTPEDCLFITDTLEDVMEGKHANVPSVVVSWGYHTEDYFKSVIDEVYFAREPKDITRFVAEHFSNKR